MSTTTRQDALNREKEEQKRQRLLVMGSLTSQAWHAIEAEQREPEMIDHLIRSLHLFKHNKLHGPIQSTDDILPLEGEVRGDDPRLFDQLPWIWAVQEFWRNVSIVRIRVATGKNVKKWFESALRAGVYCCDDTGHYRLYHSVNYIDHNSSGPFARRKRGVNLGEAVKHLLKNRWHWEREKMKIRFLVFTELDTDNSFLFRPPKGHDDFGVFLDHLAASVVPNSQREDC